MSQHPNFRTSIEALRKHISRTVSDRAERIASEVTRSATEIFVNNAKKYLDESTPKDENSARLIEDIKNNIYSSKSSSSDHSYNVTIEADPEGLVLFLEYGTGLMGLAYGHENDDLVKWNYASNLGASHGADRYVSHNGSIGWFFSSKRGTYIDKNDESPVEVYRPTREWFDVRSYERNGHIVRSHKRRYRRWTNVKIRPESVFTEGLKPIRYIYRATEDVRRALEKCSQELSAGDGYGIKVSDLIKIMESAKKK